MQSKRLLWREPFKDVIPVRMLYSMKLAFFASVNVVRKDKGKKKTANIWIKAASAALTLHPRTLEQKSSKKS
jgi:hypothetical protein